MMSSSGTTAHIVILVLQRRMYSRFESSRSAISCRRCSRSPGNPRWWCGGRRGVVHSWEPRLHNDSNALCHFSPSLSYVLPYKQICDQVVADMGKAAQGGFLYDKINGMLLHTVAVPHRMHGCTAGHLSQPLEPRRSARPKLFVDGRSQYRVR